MTIENKIDQYKQLKKSKRTIDARLAELRKHIVAWILPQDSTHDNQPYNGLQLQIRNRLSINEAAVHAIMRLQGIPIERYCKYVIDPDAIEDLYYQGLLTDDDLRRMREPKHSYALVEVGDEEDVQALDEGSGQRL